MRPSPTRSTCARSPTATATGSATCPGITSRLPYLRDLGVDALWITPFYTSPQHDHGYDVADYRDVDPLFGTLADADALLARAHELGLKVIVDLVPNHTSSEHAWFQAALAAAPGSPERARYLFRDGRGPDGAEPPNNWKSVFGGDAWTRVPDGQWYLHLFDSTQPDLDWRNPEVGDMFEEVLRFWLDRGVDGFRVDVAHGLVKEESLRDQVLPDRPAGSGPMVDRTGTDEPMWDQPEVHDVYRRWHRVLAEYDGDRMAVAEAWTQTPESMARFVRADEMQQSFNFDWLLAPWSATAFAKVITGTLAAPCPTSRRSRPGCCPTTTSSGTPPATAAATVGLARARAATLTMLALPGSAYLYQGEELGLEQVDVAPEHRQDPAYLRQKGTPPGVGLGRPRRLPGADPVGRRPPALRVRSRRRGQPWIPQPLDWERLSVEAQEKATRTAESTLAFYRRALAARREHALGSGDDVEVLTADRDVLALQPRAASPSCSTRARRPSSCRPARSSSRAARSPTACCRRTPRSGSGDLGTG